MHFHERVKFLLQSGGITQQYFAVMLGISAARLNNYLTGKTEANYSLLSDMARLLNTTVDYLLSGGINRFSQNIEFLKDFLPETIGDMQYYGTDIYKGEFSQRVKFLLKDRGLTQATLAYAIGVTPGRLNTYLSGKAEAGYSMLLKLALFLDTTIDYLLCLSGDSGETGYPDEIDSKYAGISGLKGEMFINIPVFKTGGGLVGEMKCPAILKNIYRRPYILLVSDDSISPECVTGDMLFVAPRTYIPPVSNNLDPTRLYAVRLAKDDKVGVSVRYCLTKDDVIFLRPVDLKFETIALNTREIDYKPVAGVVICRLRSETR